MITKGNDGFHRWNVRKGDVQMKRIKCYVAVAAMAAMVFAACGMEKGTTEPTGKNPAFATDVPTEITSVPETKTTEAPLSAATKTPAPEVTGASLPAATKTPTPEPTMEPVKVLTPEPTKEVTPEPTKEATPEPTKEATPEPTKEATPEPTKEATPEPTKVPATKTVTYNFNELAYITHYELEYFVQKDGALELQFGGKWKEIKFSLPEGINMEYCQKVTVKAKSEYANLTVKLYDETLLSDPWCGEVFQKYDCMGNGVVEYELYPELYTTVAGIGLMSLDDVSDVSKYKATVYSITFYLDENYKAAPTPTPVAPESVEGATLLNTYGALFGNIGTCISLSQLQNTKTLAHVKSQYNSVTLENEMKPDAMLGWAATLLSVEQAKAKGYVIPDNYKETTVPQVNFATIDRVLALCAQNGLRMRAHTLVWHSQTPNWFFRTNYNASGSFVDKEVMNARMEFYIRTVMTHVYESEYSDVIYSWDIVNEYLHADDTNWKKVYGDMGLTPSYVKLAYEIADDVLRSFGVREEVTLLFNDYNTYMQASQMISIVNYINSDRKVCDGIGMQAHLDTGYPSPTLFRDTVQAFLNAGLEVQITELDVTNTNEATQAGYLYELMSYLLALKKNGGAITGITFWGISDDVSWRRAQSPLLYSSMNKPKTSYAKVLQAYVDAGFLIAE